MFHIPRIARNPLFFVETRSLRYSHDLNEFYEKTKAVLFGSILVVALWCAVNYLLTGNSSITLIMAALIACNIGITLGADLYCMLVTIMNISPQVASGYWDDLKLTALTEEKIVNAKHAVGQLRVQHALQIVFVLRILPLITPLINGIVVVILRQEYFQVLGLFIAAFVVLIMFAPLLIYLWILEPGWHMQTLVALGIAAALKIHQHTLAVFAGIALVFMLRLIELVGVGGLVYAGIAALSFLASLGFGLFPLPLILVGTAVVIMQFHVLLRQLALWIAIKFANESL